MANAADCEFWRVSPPRLKTLGAQAKRLEEQGWTGMTVGDSQNIAPDTYTVMALAVAATSTIKLCTWVTNPLTRHPAAAAGALATLQAESGGRIEAGIGRGDSALAFLGLAPAPVGYFENYVRRLRGYLRAEDVPMQTELDGKGLVAEAKSLDLADRPMTSKLTWLPEDYRPVPVIVSASGPKVMALGARIADGVTAVVGPDPRRLAWARDEILSALKASSRPGRGADPRRFLRGRGERGSRDRPRHRPADDRGAGAVRDHAQPGERAVNRGRAIGTADSARHLQHEPARPAGRGAEQDDA